MKKIQQIVCLCAVLMMAANTGCFMTPRHADTAAALLFLTAATATVAVTAANARAQASQDVYVVENATVVDESASYDAGVEVYDESADAAYAAEDTTEVSEAAVEPIAEAPEPYCGLTEDEFMSLKSALDNGEDVSRFRPLNGLSAEQATALLALIPDESQRVEVAAAMYNAVCDKENWYLIYNAIQSEDNQKALEERISAQYGMK